MARKKIPDAIASDLLVKVRRRCCLCVYLEGDTSRKRIQLAHIDGDSSNSIAENLVPLCLDHHDEYDSQTKQSRGITKHEARSYRDRLINEIADGTLAIEEPTYRSVKRNRIQDSRELRAYGSLFAEVSRIFYSHDPVKIGGHGNLDEYEPEAHDLITRILATDGQLDLVQECREVVAKWFTEEMASQFSGYKQMAEEVDRAWKHYENLRTLYLPGLE